MKKEKEVVAEKQHGKYIRVLPNRRGGGGVVVDGSKKSAMHCSVASISASDLSPPFCRVISFSETIFGDRCNH